MINLNPEIFSFNLYRKYYYNNGLSMTHSFEFPEKFTINLNLYNLYIGIYIHCYHNSKALKFYLIFVLKIFIFLICPIFKSFNILFI